LDIASCYKDGALQRASNRVYIVVEVVDHHHCVNSTCPEVACVQVREV